MCLIHVVCDVFWWPPPFKMMAAALIEANLRQICLFHTPLGNLIPVLTRWIGERRYKNSLTQHSLTRCHVAATWPHSPCCGCREDETARPSHWAQICLRIGRSTQGVHRIVERIPLCFGLGFLARGALEGKKREPEGITPCPSLSSFPCSAAPRPPGPPTFFTVAAMWKRAWFLQVDLGKRGS